jgi:hypothetical protein
MANGKWQMANGKWQMTNDKYQTNLKYEIGMTKTGDGGSQIANGN